MSQIDEIDEIDAFHKPNCVVCVYTPTQITGSQTCTGFPLKTVEFKTVEFSLIQVLE